MSNYPSLLGEDIAELALKLPAKNGRIDFARVSGSLGHFARNILIASGYGVEEASRFASSAQDVFWWRVQYDGYNRNLRLVHIVESAVEPIENGGIALVVDFEILTGARLGERFRQRFDIVHPNAQAQAIARRALADIFQATGTPPSRNSDDLHFKPFLVRMRRGGADKFLPVRSE